VGWLISFQTSYVGEEKQILQVDMTKTKSRIVCSLPLPRPLLPETSTKSFLIRFNPHLSTKNNLNPRPFILIYIYFGRFPPQYWRAENLKKYILLAWLSIGR